MKLSEPTLDKSFSPAASGKNMVVMMSGGVDSSATALLLRDAGWNVVGVTMKIPVADSCSKRSCCGMEAAYVCRDLEIPHYYLDVQSDFAELVIEPFRRAYMSGQTPSPCVDCNTLLKFGAVWDYLEEALGVQDFATGHYARIIHDGDSAYLVRGDDDSRDQSYFLYGIPRHRLSHLHFPLGEMTKPDARKLAQEARLPVAQRVDSMELCFAGEGDYRTALGDDAFRPGPIVHIDGRTLGAHNGIANYTIGQRKGLGIAAKEPLFVIAIVPDTNTVLIGPREAALKSDVTAVDVNVLIPNELTESRRLLGKIRSQGNGDDCIVTRVDCSEITVKFDEPQFGPTPGQRLVLYDNDNRVVAGGVISIG